MRVPVTAAVVVAAGRSERFGGHLPKVLAPWRGQPLLAATLDAFDRCAAVSAVVLVATEEVEAGWRAAGAPGRKVSVVTRGGATRQESVAAGFAALPAGCQIVLVHDGARPFVTPDLILSVALAAARSGAALPILRVTDTVKHLRAGEGAVLVDGTVDRRDLGLAQTPQGFRADVLRVSLARASERCLEATDDVALVEAAIAEGILPSGTAVESVPGEPTNVKVTTREDLRGMGASRVGLGHDVHPLAAGRPFVLAGVDVWSDWEGGDTFGPVGHSDGDALCHAICDALLSAAGLSDIGTHFPDSSPENAGRPSLEFLAAVAGHVASAGFRVVNVSAVVQLERPRLAPHAGPIRQAIAAALGVTVDAVGLSAKRGEGLGDIGTGRAVRCDVVALLERA